MLLSYFVSTISFAMYECKFLDMIVYPFNFKYNNLLWYKNFTSKNKRLLNFLTLIYFIYFQNYNLIICVVTFYKDIIYIVATFYK